MASKPDIKAGGVYVEIMVRMGKLMDGLAKAKKSVREFSEDIAKVGKEMMKIGLAVGVPMGLATKRFADFDDQMRKVKAFAEATDEELVKLTATAKKLGRQSSFTAVQVGEIMGELAKAGVGVDAMEGVTKSVMDMSRASDTEAKQSAEILNQVMAQFGLKGGVEAERVASVLAKASVKTLTSVESLGESMSELGSIPLDVGATVEDVMALAGAIGDAGIRGSAAGTALKRMFTMSGAEAKKLGEIFGVNFLDAAGNIRPLVDSMEEVGEKVKNMPQGERLQKYNDAFGLLSIAVGSVVARSTTSIRDLKAELLNAPGFVAEAASEMDKGLGGSFRRGIAAVEGFALAIGDALQDDLAKWVGGLRLAVNAATEWIANNKETVVTIAKVAAGLIAAGAAIVGLAAVGTAGSLVFSGILSALVAVKAVVLGVVAAFGFLFSPLGLAVAALLAFSNAGEVAVGAVKNAFTSLTATVMPILSEIMEALKSGRWKQAAEIGMAALKLVWASTFEWFTKLVGDTVTTTVGQILRGDWAGAMKTAVQPLWVFLQKFIKDVIDLFLYIPRKIIESKAWKMLSRVMGLSPEQMQKQLQQITDAAAKRVRQAEMKLKLNIDSAGVVKGISDATRQAQSELGKAMIRSRLARDAGEFKYEGERRPQKEDGKAGGAAAVAAAPLGGSTVVLSSAAALAMSSAQNSPEARARAEMLKNQAAGLGVARQTEKNIREVLHVVQQLAAGKKLYFGGAGT